MQLAMSKDHFANLRQLVEPELKIVDNMILDYAKSHVELVPIISNYLTSAGGKRLRPILTLACSKIFGTISENAIKLAAAVEFIHTATLLHDDVVDESDKRRGKPTANNIWDSKTCILVGDFLFSQAFKLMVETHSIKALKLLSNAAANIAESEVWQLELLNNIDLSRETYFKLIAGKTAVLFAGACASGGVVSNCSEAEASHLYNFGLKLGTSFQIIDDILDYSADSTFGKKLGNDFLEGKVTLPVIEAMSSSTDSGKKELITLLNSAAKTELDFLKFKDLLASNGSLAASYKTAETSSQSAIEHLGSIPKNDITIALADFCVFLLTRKI